MDETGESQRVDRVEWLNYKQCSDLIEALKGMVKRKGEDNGRP